MHVSGETKLQRYEKIEFLGEGQVKFGLTSLCTDHSKSFYTIRFSFYTVRYRLQSKRYS